MRGFPRIKQHGCHGHDVDVYTVSCLQSSINMVIRVLEEELDTLMQLLLNMLFSG